MTSHLLRNCPRPLTAAVLTVTLTAGLTACGGGGGSGGGFLPLLPTTSTASPTPTPPPEPAPAPPPAPAPASVTPSSDPKACITTPETGSTADVGNAFEGLWGQPGTIGGQAASVGLLSIDAAGSTVGFQMPDPNVMTGMHDDFVGKLSFDAGSGTWQVSSGEVRNFTDWAPWSGSGAFSAKSSMTGTYAANAAASKAFGPWTYELSNSLALTPSFLGGEWGALYGAFNGTLNIAADGSLSGSTPSGSLGGACTLSGSAALQEPGSAKNRIAFDFTVADAAKSGDKACVLTGVKKGVGFVSISQYTREGICTRSNTLYVQLQDATGRLIAGYIFPQD
jgi:hypothetical protein